MHGKILEKRMYRKSIDMRITLHNYFIGYVLGIIGEVPRASCR